MENGWKPIATPPEQGVPVFLFGGTIYPEIGMTYPNDVGVKAELWGNAWAVCDTDAYGVYVGDPTHWRPLPAPPVTTET